MFNVATPESVGISSKEVAKFIKTLERRGLVTHSVLLMRGNTIFSECYWKPFDEKFCHRMYSETKNFVSVAIGLLEEDGMISLDDKIVDYFPEKIDGEISDYLKNQTIRHMLTMQTCGQPPLWFNSADPDRTHLYLNQNSAEIPSGMRFKYDSHGTQVLCSLVEKLTKKTLFDFLYERIFKHLGTFNTAKILKLPNGDSHGDSALLCTTRDMASFARFVMNYGTWNGKRLMNEDYLKTATSRIVDNTINCFDGVFTQGYGYQFWRCGENGFAFNGMGAQLAVCLPDKDLIFVITSDNQGFDGAKALIMSAFYEIIVDNLHDEPLPEDNKAYEELKNIENSLELDFLKGNIASAFAKEINGKKFICNNNPTGIKDFSLLFSKKEGEFRYTNAQGEKTIKFGFDKNIFGKFPQFGYSNEVACRPTTDGFLYDCAASAAWREEKKLLLKIQIIDKYFANLLVIFSFKDDYATITMHKAAHGFMEEYQGEWVAKLL